MEKPIWNTLTAGVCYYPEHWPKELWAQDLDRMKKAGIFVIRIAEFAWNKFEPTEGVFTFDFFDGFLALCMEKDVRVIMGTPTATPPAWLTERYPEVLNSDQNGVLFRHGGRKHYNYNSKVYRDFSGRIVTKLAEHYGKHPAVIGWQIDNEFNCEACEFYSEADSEAFRAFLKEKYGTLDTLNEAWGTVFWNETYTEWEQIFVPRPVPGAGWNPHLRLDYLRFISESTRSFCKMQADIIRSYKKETDFVMTNGMFAHIDNHKMTDESLDTYMYDSYPNFAFGLDRRPMEATDLNDRKWSRHLTEVRSICPHFGIMEQQSGAGGWTTRMEQPTPRPGQLALWAMQSVAQGADYISFFRWRTACFGTEMYWHGILDYDNRDNRKLSEVTDFITNLKAIEAIAGAKNVSAFAVLKDYDNEWDAEVDVWHGRIKWASEEEIFAAAELCHTPYDVIYLGTGREDDLSGYPVLFYPHSMIVTKEHASLLKNYVENGGTLILGCRSGLKDENGKMVMAPQPGLFGELTGTDVREFTLESPGEGPVSMEWNGKTYRVPVFCDVFDTPDAVPLASYANSFFAGKTALAEKIVGKGRVLHFGGTFTRELTEALFSYTGIREPFAADIKAPREIEVVKRTKGEKTYYFVLNFSDKASTVQLKRRMRQLFTGEEQEGTITLPAYGTAVYEVK